jgi:hypothetical protein
MWFETALMYRMSRSQIMTELYFFTECVQHRVIGVCDVASVDKALL